MTTDQQTRLKKLHDSLKGNVHLPDKVKAALLEEVKLISPATFFPSLGDLYARD